MIASGRLNKFVTIETPTISKDAVGGDVKTWATFKQTWANIKEIDSDLRSAKLEEIVKSGKEISIGAATIRIRKIDGLQENMRIVNGNNVYNIIGIADDSMNDGTVIIFADRGVKNG